MSDIPQRLANQVIERADNRCEYCQLSQLGQEATFHVDHVVPRSENGQTQLDNLALACVSCSLRKWAKQTALDPQSGQLTPLFNPRTDNWSDHFQWQGGTPHSIKCHRQNNCLRPSNESISDIGHSTGRRTARTSPIRT